MGDENSLTPQPLLTSIAMNFNLHPKLLRKKRAEKKIVVPLKIFDLDSFAIQALELIEYGKVVRKGRGLFRYEKFFKTEEEFEKVAEDYQATDPVFL